MGLLVLLAVLLFWAFVRWEARRSARRMWNEALADPKKMAWIEHLLKHGPPPGL